MNIFYRTPNCWLNRFIAGVVGDMDTIYEYKEALSLYFSDPARVREESSLRGLLDYINPRVTTSTIAGGIWGLGLGYTAGDLGTMHGSATALRWGLWGSSFFGTTYLVGAIRGRDDAINYGVSGGINYGLYRLISTKQVGKGILGCVVGAGVGIAYKLTAEKVYYASRESWIDFRRHMLVDNEPRRIPNMKQYVPFPPRPPASSSAPPDQKQSPPKAT